MKERPILFSAPMVRALLAGTKTQTRRVVKSQASDQCSPWFLDGFWKWLIKSTGHAAALDWFRCPYGVPGDRLWVREAWRSADTLDTLSPSGIGDAALGAGYNSPWAPLQFEADGKRNGVWAGFGPGNGVVVGPGKLRPGMFMPRWASRITLEVTEVRVERLQAVSEADAIAEGIEPDRQPEDSALLWRNYATGNTTVCPVHSYRTLWESINGAGSWDANPWVWVIAFKRVTP
jgi:hypothetical protein